MEQTPIEKSISEIKQMIEVNNLPFDPLVNRCLQILEGNKEYEKAYHRDIAEKAWDKCRISTIDNSSIEHDHVRDMEFVEVDYSVIDNDKQTYLNQNHPLCIK